MSRIFLGVIGALLVILVLGHALGPKAPKAAGLAETGEPTVPARARHAVLAKGPVDSSRHAAPAPPVASTSASNGAPAPAPAGGSRTPMIDRLVRLESKRRLAQSARFTYLDSAIVAPDSVIRRWGDRDGSPILVAFVLPNRPNAARFPARVLAAASKWGAMGLGVRFAETPDTAHADVVVRWIQKFDLDRTGQADLQSGPDGVFLGGRVTIALEDRAGRPLGEDELEMIATHEFGHVIGLPHSDNRADVMFPIAMVNRPSERDRSTAVLLYSLPPGSLREP